MSLAPRTLPGRVAFAFVALILATWIAVGGTMFVVLRGLHESATTARLTDLAVPLVVRLRNELASGQAVQSILADLASQVAGTDVGVYLQLADGRIVALGGGGGSLAGLTVDPALARGDLEQGVYRAADGSSWAWSASILRAANVRGPRALIVASPDRAPADAVRDLVAALPAVFIVTLLVGIPIAVWLSRSVTYPLRRLTAAFDALATAPDAAGEPTLSPGGPEEIRELTERFDGMRDELREGRRREAELLADLRHDLRTPLTVIEGFAEALVDGTARGEAADHAASAIAEEARRIDTLVDALGDLERLRSGTALRPEPLRASALVTEAVSRFTAPAEASAIEVVADPGPADLELTADRTAVERILANLISNAVAVHRAAAVAPGQAEARHVWVQAQPAPAAREGPGGVVFTVTDDGPGFPPGTAQRAFDRFYRADPSRTGPGSGLGLAIVRELALAHGGRAYAENVAPHGARVSVVLPALPAPPRRAPTG